MSRRLLIAGIALAVLVVVSLVLTFLPKARLEANRLASQNNLRELALFAAHHHQPNPRPDPARRFLIEVPAATIFLPDVPPEKRLSWVVSALPGLDQRKVNATSLLARVDQKQPWEAEANQNAARVRLAALLCPENTPTVTEGEPGVTCYVGIGGVGVGAPLLAPGAPRLGAFRYDGPTPFDAISDGLSQTLLYGESRADVGPWLRGGPSTTRAFDDASSVPLVGGQFGGYFPTVAHFALCDGSVRSFTLQTNPRVLLNMATIAGKGYDALPGE
jgi:Protein of unknown function (DUF1559)